MSWFVVKLGGELLLDVPRLAETAGRAIRGFLDAGHKVAVVHGAGPQANALMSRLGLKPQMVAGQRVTDAETLEVMKMALAGQAGVDVASALRIAHVPALATSGVSAGLLDATRRAPKNVSGAEVDYGLVGDVTRIDTVLLERLAAAGVVPVLSSLAGDAEGHVFNVNADTVATTLAAALKATRLFLISNVPGVLRDKNDPSSRIPLLTPEAARAQIANGAIQGGMIPKVEESLAMLDQGIGAIHISSVEGLLQEASRPGSAGTAFVRCI
ncbi:MAG: acetylglutamate kinase [Myxococcaceae bacterium]